MPLLSPTPHSRHIPQFGSTLCICTDLVDESLQTNDSHTSPFLSHSNFRSASPKPITELPMFDPTPIATGPLGTHLMITRAKAGIKHATHQISDLWVLLDFFLLFLYPLSLKDSNLLLRILLDLLPWMKKFKLCKTIVLGFWFLDSSIPTF